MCQVHSGRRDFDDEHGNVVIVDSLSFLVYHFIRTVIFLKSAPGALEIEI